MGSTTDSLEDFVDTTPAGYACEERRGRFNESACRQEYLVCIERKGVSEADCE